MIGCKFTNRLPRADASAGKPRRVGALVEGRRRGSIGGKREGVTGEGEW